MHIILLESGYLETVLVFCPNIAVSWLIWILGKYQS